MSKKNSTTDRWIDNLENGDGIRERVDGKETREPVKDSFIGRVFIEFLKGINGK